jgi:hypothetical protein
MTKSATSTPKGSPAKAAGDPVKPASKSPNRIFSQIDSPNSKGGKVKKNTTVVRIASTAFVGMQIVFTSRLLDRDDDGYNHPIHRAIEEGEEWAISNCFFFSGSLRDSLLNDNPALNTGTPYRRRAFVRLDSNATALATEEELKAIVDSVCTVSTLISYSIYFWYVFLMCFLISNAQKQFMMRDAHNKYANPYVPAGDWNTTPDHPVVVDELMTTKDIIPVVRRLYGDPETDNLTYTLPRHWARHNGEEAAKFFTPDRIQEEDRVTLGY